MSTFLKPNSFEISGEFTTDSGSGEDWPLGKFRMVDHIDKKSKEKFPTAILGFDGVELGPFSQLSPVGFDIPPFPFADTGPNTSVEEASKTYYICR